MKKIVLKESQVDKLVGKMVSEQITANGRYRQEVKIDFYYHDVTYQGHKIDWIPDTQEILTFEIDMEARSYGIKGVSVYAIRGPEEIALSMSYYPSDNDNEQEVELILRPDWEIAEVSTDENLGWIGVSQDVEMELKNDEQGNIVIDTISIESFGM